MIWSQSFSLEQLKKMNINMVKHVGIEMTEIGDNFLAGTMPVDERTQQPFGLLHGGASCVLAETLGSVASNLVVDPNIKMAVGMSLTANYFRSATSGRVHGKAMPVHLGKTTHVWDIQITDEGGKLLSSLRLTTAIVDRKK